MNGMTMPASAQALMQAAPGDGAVLTRVSLCFIAQRFNLYLRFGEPARVVTLDRWRRCAVFLPGMRFCRVHWQANEFGTTQWLLMVMQAGTPLDALQRIAGVQPGARLLLRAEGEMKVRTVLQQIDAIEAQGIAAAEVSPAYWGTLGNRLAAWTAGRSTAVPALPDYTPERHAAWLAGRGLS